ncbi:formation of crescent membranes and immature virions [Murmansk poxvirus]|uniref:Formation of crescent membranes and immature virions n=1 Tax=Murmansk poxvirus TaxID=2025359 RepID=A0A223FMR7_9POXV|nr:formation of crescent membranes and immature virions [Murmansk poxvirus]AST09280.1 formation of crescent membranes and immature virions [Murmansk poxvirus]
MEEVISSRLSEIVKQNKVDEAFLDFIIHGMELRYSGIVRLLFRLLIDIMLLCLIICTFTLRLCKRNHYLLSILFLVMLAIYFNSYRYFGILYNYATSLRSGK